MGIWSAKSARTKRGRRFVSGSVGGKADRWAAAGRSQVRHRQWALGQLCFLSFLSIITSIIVQRLLPPSIVVKGLASLPAP